MVTTVLEAQVSPLIIIIHYILMEPLTDERTRQEHD